MAKAGAKSGEASKTPDRRKGEHSQKMPSLLPPRDLLDQVDGIQQGLLQRRKVSTIGAVGAISAGALQAATAVFNSDWTQNLLSADWSMVAQRWWLLLPLVVAFLG